MKFTVNSSLLQRTLGKISGVIQARSTMPILEHFLVEVVNNTLTATATDMAIWMKVTAEVQGEEDGQLTVPAKRFLDTLRSLPETDLEFAGDATTNRITVRTAMGEYNMTGDHYNAFPKLPEVTAEEQFQLEATVLRRVIGKTTFAVSQDDLRPAMNGVLLQAREGKLRAVATDGHRLVRYDVQMKEPVALHRDVIVPVKTLQAVGRSLEDDATTVSLSPTHVRLQFPAWEVVSRLIDERYPNYESVIPAENDKTLTANRDALIQTIRRVALYASATTHQVRFDVAKNELRVAAQDVDFGWDAKEKMACTFSDTVFMIGFNASYLLDLLTHAEGENVTFKFSAPTRAGIIVPDTAASGDDLLMLVMPVRLNA
ncbi:MAG TPA: DNA polymerase III subunit beta [Bacteroidota bacterium]